MPKNHLRTIHDFLEQRVRLRTLAPSAVASATSSLRASVPPRGAFFALWDAISYKAKKGPVKDRSFEVLH